MAKTTKRLVHETIEGEAYDYYPLGKFIVAAPGVCGERPTNRRERPNIVTIVFFAPGMTRIHTSEI